MEKEEEQEVGKRSRKRRRERWKNRLREVEEVVVEVEGMVVEEVTFFLRRSAAKTPRASKGSFKTAQVQQNYHL